MRRMKKKFAYIFCLGGKCVWSGEIGTTLDRRADTDNDREEIARFIEACQPGDFITLSGGEIISCTSLE